MKPEFESKVKGRVSRRAFLAACAAGSAMATAIPVATAWSGTSQPLPGDFGSSPIRSALSYPMQRVFSPLGTGTLIYDGWTIVRTYVQGNAVVIELEHTLHDQLRIDVCRRNPSNSAGIARTDLFELILMNNGAGNSATPAQVERLARMIAAALRRTEGALQLGATELYTHEQRVALFDTNRLHFVG